MADATRTESFGPDDRLNQAILSFLNARAAGQPPDRAEFLARYPGLEGELRSFLDNEDDARSTVEEPRAVVEVQELTAAAITSFDHYEVDEVIDGGGMAVILRCRDRVLKRELAVKVLRENLAPRPGMVERFREEARIASQLQHPGIAPVHQLGTLPDGRPYFTMKLIRGRNLAALLRERPTPGQDRPRFLAVFQQVCQAVAYAHSKNVLHRDLKPLNVMVGEFGEVQVMDWGLGKVLGGAAGGGGSRPEGELPAEPASVEINVDTVRTVAAGSATQPGTVRGTFAYMPPEQARGHVARLDRRCDVFSLGAILCEILTGQPPYVGQTAGELWQQARDAETEPALARLAASGADGELVALATACLAAEPAERPADAAAVATAMTAYLDGVQEKKRQAELGRAAAEARAAEERKKRRWQLGLAAAVVLLVAGAGGIGVWRKLDRDARAAEQAHREAEHARRMAHAEEDIAASLKRSTEALAKQDLADARAAVANAETRFAAGAPAHLEAKLRQARVDVETMAELDDVRSSLAWLSEGKLDFGAVDRGFSRAFTEYGLDWKALPPEAVAERIKDSAIRESFIGALDLWWKVFLGKDHDAMEHVLGIAQRADADPRRRELRDAFLRKDQERIRELARDEQLFTQSPATILFLAEILLALGESDLSLHALRRCQEHHPRDFWLNTQVGMGLMQRKPAPTAAADAAGFFRAAITARPRSTVAYSNLGMALMQRQPDEALRACRRAVELDDRMYLARVNLGVALMARSEFKEAAEHLHRAADLNPQSGWPHANLALVYLRQGNLGEGLKAAQKALELEPDLAPAHVTLGVARILGTDLDGAIDAFHEALKRDPSQVEAHLNLSICLAKKGRFEAAFAASDQALQLAEGLPQAHLNRGQLLLRQARMAEAEAAFKRALELARLQPVSLVQGAPSAGPAGKLDMQVFTVRVNMDGRPALAAAYQALGFCYQLQGRLDEASHLFQQGLEMAPNDHGLIASTSDIFVERGEFTRAAEAVTKAMERMAAADPVNWKKMEPLLVAVRQSFEPMMEAERRLPEWLKADAPPKDPDDQMRMAVLLSQARRQPARAARLFAEAAPRAAPDNSTLMFARALMARAAALAGTGLAEEGAKLDAEEQARLRALAVTWLNGEAGFWTLILPQVPPALRPQLIPVIELKLLGLLAHSAFTGIRSPDRIAQLPEGERKACEQVWADVRKLLKMVQEGG